MKKTIQQHIADILELVEAMHREELRVYGESGVEVRLCELRHLLMKGRRGPVPDAFFTLNNHGN